MSESPIITFIRGITLLTLLVALPGIAICWNHLPSDPWGKITLSPPESNAKETQHHRKDTGEWTQSVSVFAPESIYPVLSEAQVPVSPQTQSEHHEKNAFLQNTYYNTAIRQPVRDPLPAVSPHDFETLGAQLESLGATYYKVEKWGNRGELFRVSCFVSPPGNHTYERHFHSIGADVITVMQTLIADIERWKNTR